MVSIRTPWLTTIAKGFNFVGLVAITLPIRFLIAGFLAIRRRWWHLVAFATAVVVSEVFIGTLKGLYARGRPPGSLVVPSGYSFPSEGTGRYAWGTVAVAFSGLMGLSRAYLAAHWLSDAVAGVLLGTSCALVMALLVHAIRIRREGADGPEAAAGRGGGRSPPRGPAP